jgi:hypothetical protein
VERHRQALDLAREISSSWDEADALAGLARCDAAAGRIAEARTGLRRIGAAEARGVSAELAALTG